MTPQAISDAILAALSTGAAAAATDTVKKAVADAYGGLKSIIQKKFGSGSDAAQALEKLESKPDSEGRLQTLHEELAEVNAGSDAEVAAAVQVLVEAIRARPQSEAHAQSAHGQNIAQADRGSTATVHVSTWTPPKNDG
jgi:hypothetical protein